MEISKYLMNTAGDVKLPSLSLLGTVYTQLSDQSLTDVLTIRSGNTKPVLINQKRC